ncbi:DUF3221 domain-containing protein [Amphibacillus xylanus]|nr:DUF3221 domain-containing protein [Amphibacillus xylanus]
MFVTFFFVNRLYSKEHKKGMSILRRIIYSTFILLLVVSLFGCQRGLDRDPDLTGYVVEIAENNILIASETPVDLSKNGGVSNYYDMVWFSNPPHDLSYGDKVNIWYDEIQDSYPSRSTIVEYTIIEDISPNGAKFSESEVLNKVLSQLNSKPSELFAVHETRYNSQNKTWQISLMEIWTQEILTIEYSELES